MITKEIKKLVCIYQQEHGLSPLEINSGECLYFAEEIHNKHPKIDILCDATFYWAFDDIDQEELANPIDYGSTPNYDYKEVGIPCHYWLYYQGRHYDAECPEGVENFFELPIILRWVLNHKQQ